MFEPENYKNKFELVPAKLPSDNIRKVLKDMSFHTDVEKLSDCEDFVILDSLKSMNLFQSIKADEARLNKIKTEEAEDNLENLDSLPDSFLMNDYKNDLENNHI